MYASFLLISQVLILLSPLTGAATAVPSPPPSNHHAKKVLPPLLAPHPGTVTVTATVTHLSSSSSSTSSTNAAIAGTQDRRPGALITSTRPPHSGLTRKTHQPTTAPAPTSSASKGPNADVTTIITTQVALVASNCKPMTMCADAINKCGDRYGGCFDVCSGPFTAQFTAPPCNSASVAREEARIAQEVRKRHMATRAERTGAVVPAVAVETSVVGLEGAEVGKGGRRVRSVPGIVSVA